MTDEKYTFIEDVRVKKQMANSARYKQTHTGKGGRAKLPSDYMKKKELEAMNGECKTYRLNSPMKWFEFKAMPDELKISYIKLIREKYGATDSAISDMLGVTKATFCHERKRLGLEPTCRGGLHAYDRDGFLTWAMGVPVQKEVQELEATQEAPVEATHAEEQATVAERRRMVPDSGTMVFEGEVEEILNTVSVLLGGSNAHISITWDLLEGAQDDQQ